MASLRVPKPRKSLVKLSLGRFKSFSSWGLICTTTMAKSLTSTLWQKHTLHPCKGLFGVTGGIKLNKSSGLWDILRTFSTGACSPAASPGRLWRSSGVLDFRIYRKYPTLESLY